MTKSFELAKGSTDARENGRIILAHGEVTGHAHEVVGLGASVEGIPPAQFFEEPDGRRVLIVERACVLTHQEHGPITLDPTAPTQIRQGDVLLHPLAAGVWQCIRQSEYDANEIRRVAD